jgi:hypothetical protein
MKICGIEIDKNQAIIMSIERYDDDTIEVTDDLKKIVLENDEESQSIWDFIELVKSLLDTICPEIIGIIKLNKKGLYPVGAISSKVEALIQTYNKEIVFVAPSTLKTYFSKNALPLNSKHKYQKPALELAYFLLQNIK